MDQQLDARLVRTFAAAVAVIRCFRHRNYGWLLSELGAYRLGPEHAPAGTKRLSNLLRSRKWDDTLLTRFLWTGAQARVQALTQAGEEALLLWDESVLEACVRTWGRQVLHVWDRGYAGSPWLGLALQQRVRFVLRWPKGWKLQRTTGRSCRRGK